MTQLQAGDAAPDFTLPMTGGGTLSLSALRGRKVVLYFYPKDNTSGCTREACEFRDSSDQIDAADAVVVGISPDGVASHERFRQKYGLPFALLADEDHAVAERYGVWQEKSMYGKKYWGIVRTTFLIGEDGTIRRVWSPVRVSGHAADVLAAVTV